MSDDYLEVTKESGRSERHGYTMLLVGLLAVLAAISYGCHNWKEDRANLVRNGYTQGSVAGVGDAVWVKPDSSGCVCNGN